MTKHAQAAAETLDPSATSLAPPLTESLRPVVIAEAQRLLHSGAKMFYGIDPHLSPDHILQDVARLGRWIERARDRDDTPLLLQVPDRATSEPTDVTWLELFAALSEHAKRVMAHGVTWVPRPDDVILLSQAISNAQELVERVKIGVNGSGVMAEENAELHSRVFGDRSITRSRSGMRLELGYLLVGIDESPDAPPGVRILVPTLRTAKRQLAIAVEGKRLPTQVKQYGVEVHVAVFALLLAMNEFLSWAAATATMSRLRTFRRIVAPRHRADGTPVHRLDPDAPAEEDEEIDLPPSEDEEDVPESGLPEPEPGVSESGASEVETKVDTAKVG